MRFMVNLKNHASQIHSWLTKEKESMPQVDSVRVMDETSVRNSTQ